MKWAIGQEFVRSFYSGKQAPIPWLRLTAFLCVWVLALFAVHSLIESITAQTVGGLLGLLIWGELGRRSAQARPHIAIDRWRDPTWPTTLLAGALGVGIAFVLAIFLSWIGINSGYPLIVFASIILTVEFIERLSIHLKIRRTVQGR